MKSMTGFGSARVEYGEGQIVIETRSVNQRFFDCQVRLFQSAPSLEDAIAKKVKSLIIRGKVEVFVRIEGEIRTSQELQVDELLVDQYIATFHEIRKKETNSLPLDINRLLMNESLVRVAHQEQSFSDEFERCVLEGVDQALQSLLKMREQEGSALLLNIKQEIKQVTNHCEHIAEVLPRLLDEYKSRLHAQINTLVASHEIDESRILTEVALLADKVDISEEIVRLKTHIQQFLRYCQLSEPIGRRLDFLIQEMNREVNTIGSKASDSFIRQEVVEMKGHLEKVKEQVQNIE
ncbi:YicC/YloC family endoribonuclease [Halalkalibacter sp. APA_J-10(15)]|uniref:YicC/YloC family endoribonuclease n=1 Tax=Halalkalibacter sp. APA_J-10(15) TaxID=2933805 RepID=UPI001FF21899|nr:YicC/YloC family endoribonuclease [Halalkalibacter sp. APA_J-10(15)]MCK0470698.1 YicC family protein [Halalkalibacter sp. APA_J-10(15)]